MLFKFRGSIATVRLDYHALNLKKKLQKKNEEKKVSPQMCLQADSIWTQSIGMAITLLTHIDISRCAHFFPPIQFSNHCFDEINVNETNLWILCKIVEFKQSDRWPVILMAIYLLQWKSGKHTIDSNIFKWKFIHDTTMIALNATELKIQSFSSFVCVDRIFIARNHFRRLS